MIWTILALASLTLMGGFIAYYADRLGRRLGKKKVTWRGLRPRHTAMLITSLTGAFISLLSIVTLLIVNPPLRHAILYSERIIDDTRSQISDLTVQRKQSEDSRRDAENRAQIASMRYAGKNEELQSVQKRILDQDKQAKESQAALLKVQKAVEEKTAKVARLDAERLRFAAQLQNAQRQLAATDKTLRETSRQNEDLMRTKLEAESRMRDIQTASAKLTAEITDLTAKRDKLAHDNAALLEGGRRQAENNEQLRIDNERLALDNARARSLSRELVGERDVALNAGYSIEQSYKALRQGKFSLRVGAELARRTIDPHSRPEAVQRELVSLLDEASAAAMTRGAAKGENGLAVRIAENVVTSVGVRRASEEASLAKITERLTASDAPVVVVIYVVNNSVEGEQVAVQPELYEVKTLFQKGDPIATCQVNGSESTDRVFDALNRFLGGDVRDAALKAGIIPQTDPETGRESVGSIGATELLKVAERIKRMRGPVVVTAVAADRTTSADPIRPTFKLSRSPLSIQ